MSYYSLLSLLLIGLGVTHALSTLPNDKNQRLYSALSVVVIGLAVAISNHIIVQGG